MFDTELTELQAQVVDVVVPRLHPAENIVGCHSIDVQSFFQRNILWQDGDPEDDKKLRGGELLERMVDAGWEVASMSWTREDGSPNYGHEPTANHKLIAVMVKVKSS